jgi:ribosomal protein L44E
VTGIIAREGGDIDPEDFDEDISELEESSEPDYEEQNRREECPGYDGWDSDRSYTGPDADWYYDFKADREARENENSETTDKVNKRKKRRDSLITSEKRKKPRRYTTLSGPQRRAKAKAKTRTKRSLCLALIPLPACTLTCTLHTTSPITLICHSFRLFISNSTTQTRLADQILKGSWKVISILITVPIML